MNILIFGILFLVGCAAEPVYSEPENDLIVVENYNESFVAQVDLPFFMEENRESYTQNFSSNHQEYTTSVTYEMDNPNFRISVEIFSEIVDTIHTFWPEWSSQFDSAKIDQNSFSNISFLILNDENFLNFCGENTACIGSNENIMKTFGFNEQADFVIFLRYDALFNVDTADIRAINAGFLSRAIGHEFTHAYVTIANDNADGNHNNPLYWEYVTGNENALDIASRNVIFYNIPELQEVYRTNF